MEVYAKNAHATGSHTLLEVAVTLNLPFEPELLQTITTFPFNVILAVMVFLVIGIIITFTRKPTRPKKANVDGNNQSMQKVDEENHNSVHEANIAGGAVQGVEEEIPLRFEGYKDGVVKLYNWFYRFARRRLNGVTDNMTPRELQSVVLGSIPSNGAPALEYLVTSFEIANYSDFKITKEIVDKNLRAIEVLKDFIDNRNSYVRDHNQTNVETYSRVQA